MIKKTLELAHNYFGTCARVCVCMYMFDNYYFIINLVKFTIFQVFIIICVKSVVHPQQHVSTASSTFPFTKLMVFQGKVSQGHITHTTAKPLSI